MLFALGKIRWGEAHGHALDMQSCSIHASGLIIHIGRKTNATAYEMQFQNTCSGISYELSLLIEEIQISPKLSTAVQTKLIFGISDFR